jgi:uncharacterized protein (DUF4415 family)
MRDNYDFSGGKRGSKRALPPPDQVLKHSKVRITIMVDGDVLAAFKAEAETPGALPYQTRINQVLRSHVERTPQPADALLQDDRFIGRLAERLADYQRQHHRAPPKRRTSR